MGDTLSRALLTGKFDENHSLDQLTLGDLVGEMSVADLKKQQCRIPWVSHWLRDASESSLADLRKVRLSALFGKQTKLLSREQVFFFFF